MSVAIAGSLPGIAAVGCHARATSRCSLPLRDCDEGPRCAELVRFLPAEGPGYEDVPVDDEVSPERSTSYLRRDLRTLIQYATAKVACVAPSPLGPLALGDMSDDAGDTPGTKKGNPRHPPGTHVAGRDIDLAYFQVGQPNNHLRSICSTEEDGVEQHHCVAPPTTLDVRRTALLIGALFESSHVRVIGVDGAAAPLLQAEIRRLCDGGQIAAASCGRIRLGFETEDRGEGWFYGHDNHLHVSWSAP